MLLVAGFSGTGPFRVRRLATCASQAFRFDASTASRIPFPRTASLIIFLSGVMRQGGEAGRAPVFFDYARQISWMARFLRLWKKNLTK